MGVKFSDKDIKKMNKELNKSKNKAEKLLTDKDKTKKTINDAFSKAAKNEGPISRVFEDLKLLVSLVKDYLSGEYKEIHYGSIVAIVGGLIYFLAPLDFITDFIPIAGLTDDVFILGLVIKQVSGDLKKYAQWKSTIKKISI